MNLVLVKRWRLACSMFVALSWALEVSCCVLYYRKRCSEDRVQSLIEAGEAASNFYMQQDVFAWLLSGSGTILCYSVLLSSLLAWKQISTIDAPRSRRRLCTVGSGHISIWSPDHVTLGNQHAFLLYTESLPEILDLPLVEPPRTLRVRVY